jgi:type IV secretion system protein VirD4
MSKASASSGLDIACRLGLIAACGLAVYGLAVIGLRFQGLVVLLLGVAVWRKLKQPQITTAHGSSRVASSSECEAAGLYSEDRDAVLLGRSLAEAPSLPSAVRGLVDPRVRSHLACRKFFAAAYSRRWQSERLIRTKNHVHIASFSPAGGGKGTAVVIPNLMANPLNSVIVDVKGELWDATAEHRRKHFGKNTYRLDPWSVCGPDGDTCNPLDFIDQKRDDFLDQCRAFANPLIIRGTDEKQPHFNDYAEMNLIGLTALVCCYQADRARRHLGTVRHCASSKDIYQQSLEMMQQTTIYQGVLKMLGGQLSFPAAEEQGSVFSTFARQTGFLDSPLVARNVASSSFDPMELKTGNADLYLILPFHLLTPLQRLMRLWINTVMARVTEGKPDESRKVMWYLDEAAHYCRGIQAVEDAVTLGRGYGMRMWFIFQSLGQLKTTFGEKAPTILDNIQTRQYFNINSLETAKEISEQIGTATITNVSTGGSSNTSRPIGYKPGEQGSSHSSGTSYNVNEIGRRLYLPEEILTLPRDLVLIFHQNLPVLPARLVKWFEAPEFKDGGTAAPRRGLGPWRRRWPASRCLPACSSSMPPSSSRRCRPCGPSRPWVAWDSVRQSANSSGRCRRHGSRCGPARGRVGAGRAATSSRFNSPERPGRCQVPVVTKGPSSCPQKTRSRGSSTRSGPSPRPPITRPCGAANCRRSAGRASASWATPWSPFPTRSITRSRGRSSRRSTATSPKAGRRTAPRPPTWAATPARPCRRRRSRGFRRPI